MNMQYVLSESIVVIKKKKILVKQMRREKARHDRLRLRRSILGQEQMFGRSQQKALSFAFAGKQSKCLPFTCVTCVTCVSLVCHLCVTCVTGVTCVTCVSLVCHLCVTCVSLVCH